MRTIRTPKKRKKVLEALSEGLSISGACRAASISRTALFEWKKDDPDFSREYEEALETGTDLLEDDTLKCARYGYEEPIFYQGKEVARVKRPDTTLKIFLLKARRPDKYRDNSKVEIDTNQLDAIAEALKQ